MSSSDVSAETYTAYRVEVHNIAIYMVVVLIKKCAIQGIIIDLHGHVKKDVEE